MKIQITENVEQVIDGYLMIPIVYGKIDVDAIPNNSATDIVAENAPDSVYVDDIMEFFQKVASKVRTNGRLFVSGTDLSLLCKDIISGEINAVQFNKLTTQKRSLYPTNDIVNIMLNLGLKIESVQIKGNNYEIRATRSN
jgi:hypothetical protein